MKLARRSRWLWGAAFALVLGPALLAWWLTAGQAEAIAIERLLPDRMAGVARVWRLEPAWQAHWMARAQVTPEAALRELMLALDKWPRWQERYGEEAANLRLRLYQKAVFEALGREAWLVFGEWGGEAEGTGQVGLVVLVRGDTPVRARFGELIGLVMDDYQLRQHRHGGSVIYEYQDKKVSRSVAFCHVGGWICASVQQRGLGPLPLLIDQAAQPGETRGEPYWRPGRIDEMQPRRPALAASFWPERFWGQLRLFYQQRDQALSEESQSRLEYWQQRLEGIEQIDLVQAGVSLLDLDLTLSGPRPARLVAQLRSKLAEEPAAGVETAAGRDLPRLGQIELSLGLARAAGPLAGYTTEELLERLDPLAPWLGELTGRLSALLSEPAGAGEDGRVGVALYPGMLPILPGAVLWVDQPPMVNSMLPPGQFWPRVEQAEELDLLLRIGLAPQGEEELAQPVQNPPTAPYALLEADWLDFERRQWRRNGARPLLFATANFDRLANEMDRMPLALLDRKARRRLERADRLLSALALSTGCAMVRVDARGDRLVLGTATF